MSNLCAAAPMNRRRPLRAPPSWLPVSLDSDGKVLWARLAPAGQQHVLQFWDSLGADEKAKLKADVESVDLDDLQKWYSRTKGRHPPKPK